MPNSAEHEICLAHECIFTILGIIYLSGTRFSKQEDSFLMRRLKYIMRASRCNVDPLTPHFHIVKVGFTWVYIIF